MLQQYSRVPTYLNSSLPEVNDLFDTSVKSEGAHNNNDSEIVSTQHVLGGRDNQRMYPRLCLGGRNAFKLCTFVSDSILYIGTHTCCSHDIEVGLSEGSLGLDKEMDTKRSSPTPGYQGGPAMYLAYDIYVRTCHNMYKQALLKLPIFQRLLRTIVLLLESTDGTGLRWRPRD